ncbi:hypothetical protein [uncultured Clostridium sp.]|uniref:SWIM zinc finger family protein n=1 Tax=uncultured Clostridium sp. TaxID=59620 RepID=UPI0025EA093B|nr:hypothetical protein [uncultured Clostridium sp.]
MSFYRYYQYETTEDKKEKAEKSLKKLRKKNPNISPVIIKGNKIAQSWWGSAWNKNLEKYADLKNRMGRGKNYVKNGLVLDLQIKTGEIDGIVQGSGSNYYEVNIKIDKLKKSKWKNIMEFCNHKIDTLETLIEGKFPKEFQEIFNKSEYGLFPHPKEIHFKCNCPDSARVCKHVAAVLYGTGARIDEDPLLFFKLRDVDFQDLLKKSIEEKMNSMLKNAGKKSKRVIDDNEIEDLFGL